MGRKIRAAKASLVAAFLAAGGTAAAKATPASAAAHTQRAAAAARLSDSARIDWGDALIGFLKLDGFPAYLKVDGFAALTSYYKEALLSDAAALYEGWPSKVGDVLDLYQKADAGPLSGILIGLEQYLKYQSPESLADYLKTDAGLNAYQKFRDFFTSLQGVAKEDDGASALDYFWKLTGIDRVPAVQEILDGGDVIG